MASGGNGAVAFGVIRAFALCPDFSARGWGPRGAEGGWWLHDLRRTLATGLQRLGVRLEVTEAVLNHLSGSRAGVVGIYQRHDWAEEKRCALDAWSAHLLAAAEGRSIKGKVLTLSRA